MAKRSMFVGMDVHKESIDISIAQAGRTGEVRHYGVIAGDLTALDNVPRALRAPGRRLHFVYEAGPCGFGIYRHLTGQGEACTVVSPSHIPKRSGDRIKTDRRDGNALARLHRAGELTAIDVPTAEDEAIRDLVRAREDAVGVSTQAKHRLAEDQNSATSSRRVNANHAIVIHHTHSPQRGWYPKSGSQINGGYPTCRPSPPWRHSC
jgi:transposase